MGSKVDTGQALDIWRDAICESVRGDGADLSARQMAVLLTVYRGHAPIQVRELAAFLNLPKPAISRSLDRLCILGFLRRKSDEADRRNVLIHRTVAGAVYLSEFAELVVASVETNG